MTKITPLEFRLIESIELTDTGCWMWIKQLDRSGYGRITVPKEYKEPGVRHRVDRAHRVAYKVLRGSVPEGMELHHVCENKGCINPDHLEPVTRKEHRRKRLPEECKHGHPFDDANTYVGKDGRRHCRTCGRAAVRAYTRRKKQGRA